MAGWDESYNVIQIKARHTCMPVSAVGLSCTQQWLITLGSAAFEDCVSCDFTSVESSLKAFSDGLSLVPEFTK